MIANQCCVLCTGPRKANYYLRTDPFPGFPTGVELPVCNGCRRVLGDRTVKAALQSAEDAV